MKTMREMIDLAESMFGAKITQEAKLTPYKAKEDKETDKEDDKKKEKTDEDASMGSVSSGSMGTTTNTVGRKKNILRRK